MLRGLDDFLKKPKAYKKRFLLNCEIQEKVSAFYFHVRILSESKVVVYKSDYKEIKQEDIILNKMWKDPVEEIPEILFKNPDVTKQMIGWTLSFFYFPTEKPLVVKYDLSGWWKYLLAFATDEKRRPVDIDSISDWIDLSNYSSLVRHKGYTLKDEERTEEDKKLVEQALRADTVDSMLQWIEKIVDSSDKKTNMIASSLQEAEGVVLRWKGDIYQVVYNSPKRDVKDNRLSLEFFIHSFCRWLRENEWQEQVKSTYVNTVCSLFYCYWKAWMSDKKKLEVFKYYNIKAEDLESPTFGYYPGTCYELITHKQVRELCMNDPLLDNMFKILLNALKKTKTMREGSMLVSEDDIRVWNDCVAFIKKYANPLEFLNTKKKH